MDKLARPARRLGNLSAHVLTQLEAILATPTYKNGGRLPPEAELAAQFGVSRPVLRNALAQLREEGRIVSRRGSANFVQPQAEFSPAPSDIKDLAIQTVFDMKRCMRFREIVECAAAEDAARLRDAEGLRVIEEAQHHMLDLQPGESVFTADFEFHMAVAQATRNPYYGYTLSALRDQVRLTVEFTRKLQDRPSDQVAPRVVEEHGRVLEAIRSGDPSAAREAMGFHMRQSVVRLLG